MPDDTPTAGGRAIFLSYSREDAEAARRVADALRAFGVEVWFDQNELRGGDSWDQKIKRQIRECSLFVPIISKHTQTRFEGYFRREWKLGVERTHDMVAGVAFIVPVVIDETLESAALVPEEFMRYQWTRLPHGVPTPEFVGQVQRLLEAPGLTVQPALAHPTGAAAASHTGPTPAPPRRAMPLWAWGVIAAVGAGVAAVLLIARKPEAAPEAPKVAAAAAPAAPAPVVNEKSIAVLPFDNMSEEKDASAFFADGVHEDILTNLSFIRDLRVVSRTSVMQYRGTTKPIGQIARELGVAYILEGSVRRAGSKVRVTGQLIRAATDEHVWAKAYDRDITDVFAIQAELAQSIAEALQAAISPAEKTLLDAKPTANSAAYDLYLKARAERNSGGLGTLSTVESWLVSAVQLDPAFAEAWAQLGALHAYLHFNEDDVSEVRLEKAKAAIETAVRLAPDDPVVIEMQGDYYYYSSRDYERAAAQYRRLLDLRPNSPEAYGSLGLIYRRQGHWADSLASFRKALELDPHVGRYRTSLAQLLETMNQFDEARAEYHRMVADHPELLYWGFQEVLVPYYATGSTREADAWFAGIKPLPGDTAMVLYLRRTWARLRGDYAEAVRLDAQQPYYDGFEQPHWQQDLDVAWDYVGNGDGAKGKALAQENLPTAKAELAKQPLSSQAWVYLGFSDALLGDRVGALAAARRLTELMPESADATSGVEQSRYRASLLAWAGEKDEAIAEFSRLVRLPFGPQVNATRHDVDWLPLLGDPRFEAILSDPKSNAPRP